MTFFILAAWVWYWPLEEFRHKLIVGGLIAALVYLLYKIWPYTILAKKEMHRVIPSGGDDQVTIFAANVLQENTEYDRLLQQIKSTDPDIIFMLETNQSWHEAMKELGQDYPYSILEPQENTYGLLFYSKLELLNPEVRFLVKDDIPSIEAIIKLRSGQPIKIYGLHPEPPVPGENLYSTAKDKELMKVALKVKKEKLPCIVFGDLNDVAWSHTTELFRKVSGLLDPRRGRGFYSTFSAHHWFIRYPLDYIFGSREFGLVSMKRMPKNGSDHFATLTHLIFQKQLLQVHDQPTAEKEEVEEAAKMATQEVKS
ncbi:MAG: endonuclease/exonuclease/phosphatase family protein [Flavisolibacter sp.]